MPHLGCGGGGSDVFCSPGGGGTGRIVPPALEGFGGGLRGDLGADGGDAPCEAGFLDDDGFGGGCGGAEATSPTTAIGVGVVFCGVASGGAPPGGAGASRVGAWEVASSAVKPPAPRREYARRVLPKVIVSPSDRTCCPWIGLFPMRTSPSSGNRT
jgi:hypothetical protein